MDLAAIANILASQHFANLHRIELLLEHGDSLNMDISQGSVATESHTNTLLSVPTELTSVYLAKWMPGHHSVFYEYRLDALKCMEYEVESSRPMGRPKRT